MVRSIALPAAPTRLVARQVSEMMSARHRRWVAMLGTDPLTAFVLAVVLGAGMQHQPYRAAPDGSWIPAEAAIARARPVSGSAVALSMGIPLTTVRRHASDLVASGLLLRRPNGLVVVPSFFDDPRHAASLPENRVDLSRVLVALARAGYAPALRWSPDVFDIVPPGVVERALLTFTLRALETFTTRYEGFLPGMIVGRIVEMNVRPVTHDPVLAARYADVPPPDALRVPVSIRALAQELALPFETVRRRVAVLVEAGTVVRDDRGVMVPARRLDTPACDEDNRRILMYFEQMLGQLSALAHPATRAA